MKSSWDRIWVGIVLGLIGALVGFVSFGLLGAQMNEVSWMEFVEGVFFHGSLLKFQDKVITISILVDVVLFYFFMRREWYNLCKGLLAVVILAVPVAAYFY